MSAAARAAYDAVAAGYDEQVAPSAWVRERLWQRLDALFASGTRVLDATAGTGLDAAHLAARGVRVTACDLSPGMLARLALRLPGIPTFAADLNALEKAPLTGPFDGLISTFAGVNAAADLGGFARAAARLLRPRGILFLHALNRWPLGDLARRLRPGGRFGTALAASFRGRRSVTIEGIEVPHQLWTPRALARVFAADFGLRRIEGQAVMLRADALPHPGMNARATSETPAEAGFSRRLWGSPAIYRRAGTALEGLLSRLPLFRSAGTFFTLELVRC